MTVNLISTYLIYAQLQMAAEALFEPGFQGSIPAAILELGNKHASKFTETQAKQFVTEWTVIAHQANTGTGFSGTVFECLIDDPARGLVKGQQVVSFRSTEFIDDAVRDNKATNTLELKEFGWAFGQISDMKNWVDKLYAAISDNARRTIIENHDLKTICFPAQLRFLNMVARKMLWPLRDDDASDTAGIGL